MSKTENTHRINTTTDTLEARREAFEARQEAKRERYADLAGKARIASNDRAAAAHRIADFIPMGQPILVGHHSERRHRRDLARIENNMRAAIASDEKAKYYADKAENYGTHGISSDDPDAIQKLQVKLTDFEAEREHYKAVNKAWKAKDRVAALKTANVTPAEMDRIEQFFRLCPYHKQPYPAYSLSNLAANIRRIKDRITEIEKLEVRTEVEKITDAYTYREDPTDNRVLLIFPGKPSEDIRQALRSHGFKWSPTRGAWVRQLNNAGIYAASVIMKILDNSTKNNIEPSITG